MTQQCENLVPRLPLSIPLLSIITSRRFLGYTSDTYFFSLKDSNSSSLTFSTLNISEDAGKHPVLILSLYFLARFQCSLFSFAQN